jgi:hypothetical protein
MRPERAQLLQNVQQDGHVVRVAEVVLQFPAGAVRLSLDAIRHDLLLKDLLSEPGSSGLCSPTVASGT